MIESEGLDDCIGLDVLGNSDISSEDEDDKQKDELFTSCAGNKTGTVRSTGKSEEGRKRRLSKKQKRKRRDQFKLCLNGLRNLGNLFDATDEISDAFTDVAVTRPDVGIHHRVPSLVELCLKANRRKQRHSDKRRNTANTCNKQRTELPYGMKKLISHWGWSQKQLENQLSFFLNKVLPLVEIKMENREYVKYINTETNKNIDPVFPKRSVWVNLPYAPEKSMLKDHVYGSEKTPSFLFTPSAHYHREIERFYISYSRYYIYDYVCTNNAMWGEYYISTLLSVQ